MGLECHLPKTHRNLTGKKRKTMWVLKNLRANAAINDCIASVSLSAFKQLPAMCARPTRTLYFSSQGRNQLTGFYCWSFLGLIKTWAKQTPPVTGEKEKNKIKGKNSLKEKKKKSFFLCQMSPGNFLWELGHSSPRIWPPVRNWSVPSQGKREGRKKRNQIVLWLWNNPNHQISYYTCEMFL